jgi:putative peptidoglycan lipid II flippase
MGVTSYVVWRLFDAGLGRSLVAQLISVGLGVGAGVLVYARCVLAMAVPEAHQIRQLLLNRAHL